ncbi:hypothetical protein RJ641_015238 [Dillenia turbinata]|uniref:Uncharacterized protein n=1 Tax=Dillenia turbinata TaxID=194707 RepID=A0AAN8YY11_9MAGN
MGNSSGWFDVTFRMHIVQISSGGSEHMGLAFADFRIAHSILVFTEISITYFTFSTDELTLKQSSRFCNSLALLQCMATHPEIRKGLLKGNLLTGSETSSSKKIRAIKNHIFPFLICSLANLPYYVYPFLDTTRTENAFTFMRLTGLGVLYDDEDTIHFFSERDYFPYAYAAWRGMSSEEKQNDLVRSSGRGRGKDIRFHSRVKIGNRECMNAEGVATFIIERILSHKVGLEYCCPIAERFYSVSRILADLVEAFAEQPYARLLRHVINCYYRMSESPRACDGLIGSLPAKLADNTFHSTLRNDPVTILALQKLLNNISGIRPYMPYGSACLGGYSRALDKSGCCIIVSSGDSFLILTLQSSSLSIKEPSQFGNLST